ncbi:histidine phosphatase family protein [Thalassotalea crassostreae]|uniref:histidine phosphatase family protein n=1 Tax=Thalassotalea crassostreae TaxID=1763536 RepID=UPI0008382901|nr:phosphoglycerate mutase family protein [Thalassotalea crassostreae]
MRKFLFCLSFILTPWISWADEKQHEKFTIYLVRHAEKLSDTSDPKLTQCGIDRAVHLNNQLINVPLSAIYSSDYQRTKMTAAPLVANHNVDLSIYDPRELDAFSKKLIKLKTTALVVGHSNTTAVLAGLLANESLPAFDESIYDRLYQVTFIDGKPHLQLLQMSFVCVSK